MVPEIRHVQESSWHLTSLQQCLLKQNRRDDERADNDLPAKMRARQCDVMAKPRPEHPLGIGRLRAHLPRKLSLAIGHRLRANHVRHRLWTPTPDPSPQGGGEQRRRRI